MPKYLDENGLLYFWQKIKAVFSSKAEGVKTITRSGTTFTVTRADDTTFTFTQQDNTVAKTTTTPKANGTAAIGSETKYAAGDHVHPLQTTISGNAGTATTLQTARTIDGVSFNGSANIIHFGTSSSAASAKSSTGATSVSANTLSAGRVYLFVYDGTNYELIGDLNTTYTAASATPLMDGTGAVGTSSKYAREDHVHPSDTTKVDKVDGKGLSARELALIEPFSISAHALSRARIVPGDRLLIMGAGPIGLFALLRAKSLGAKVAIADLLPGRLALAKEYGADMVINSREDDLMAKCEEFTDGDGFDVCVEACGAPETFLGCIDAAAHGANVILIGNGKRETTFLHSIILKKELNIFGSRNAYTKDFETLIELVRGGKADVKKMISGIYPVDGAPEAFDALARNDGSLRKILIGFGED